MKVRSRSSLLHHPCKDLLLGLLFPLGAVWKRKGIMVTVVRPSKSVTLNRYCACLTKARQLLPDLFFLLFFFFRSPSHWRLERVQRLSVLIEMCVAITTLHWIPNAPIPISSNLRSPPVIKMTVVVACFSCQGKPIQLSRQNNTAVKVKQYSCQGKTIQLSR